MAGSRSPHAQLPAPLLSSPMGYTQGYGAARAEYMLAHPDALAIGSSRHREVHQGQGHWLLQLQA